MKNCDECGGLAITDHKRGEIICGECGVVLQERIIVSDHRLGGIISRIRYGNNRVRCNRSISKINSICSQLQLPRVVRDTAMLIVKNGIDDHTYRGRSIDSIVIGSICVAMRQRRIPVDMIRLSEITMIGIPDINRYFREIVSLSHFRLPVDEPLMYISKILSELSLPQSLHKQCEILIRSSMIQGKSPKSFAIASVYHIARINGYEISQKMLSRKYGISTTTIRKRMIEFENTELTAI